MKFQLNSRVYPKVLLALLLLLLIIFIGTTFHFFQQNKTVFAELEGARNLISLQSDRSDLLDIRIAELETKLRGAKNCNFSVDQALKWEYSQQLLTNVPMIGGRGPLANYSDPSTVLNAPHHWCLTPGSEVYFYLNEEKYFLTFDVRAYGPIEKISRHFNYDLQTNVFLERGDLVGVPDKIFTMVQENGVEQTVQVKIPLTRRAEFLALFNRMLGSVRLATEDEVNKFNE